MASTNKNPILEQYNSLVKLEKYRQSEWYGIRSLLGHDWASYFCILGARESGKSYSVMEFFIRQWKLYGIPFYWLRLKETATKKLLANNAAKFVDADIARRYDLELTVKGDDVFDHGEKMATILALSTSYNTKGVAEFDKDFIYKKVVGPSGREKQAYYHIGCDEIMFERDERVTFDPSYAFITQLENLIRSTSHHVRIFLIGNNLNEVSDILSLFDFIPERFGRYKLKSKKCVIDYLPCSSKYYERRSKSVIDVLTRKLNLSNYTNEIKIDNALIDKKRLVKPLYSIVFFKDVKYIVWSGNIVSKWKEGLNIKTQIAMRPYQDLPFVTQARDSVINQFDCRGFKFHDLITFKKFENQLRLLKPRK